MDQKWHFTNIHNFLGNVLDNFPGTHYLTISFHEFELLNNNTKK
jgi:hypothetical protein